MRVVVPNVGSSSKENLMKYFFALILVLLNTIVYSEPPYEVIDSCRRSEAVNTDVIFDDLGKATFSSSEKEKGCEVRYTIVVAGKEFITNQCQHSFYFMFGANKIKLEDALNQSLDANAAPGWLNPATARWSAIHYKKQTYLCVKGLVTEDKAISKYYQYYILDNSTNNEEPYLWYYFFDKNFIQEIKAEKNLYLKNTPPEIVINSCRQEKAMNNDIHLDDATFIVASKVKGCDDSHALKIRNKIFTTLECNHDYFFSNGKNKVLLDNAINMSLDANAEPGWWNPAVSSWFSIQYKNNIYICIKGPISENLGYFQYYVVENGFNDEKLKLYYYFFDKGFLQQHRLIKEQTDKELLSIENKIPADKCWSKA